MKSALHAIIPGQGILANKPRTPEEQEARIECLRVATPLAYASSILAAITAIAWGLACATMTPRSDWTGYLFPLGFAALAGYQAYFRRRAKQITGRRE